MWHACADKNSHLKTNNKFDPPHPRGGLGGYLLFKNISRRTTPKFGMQVRKKTLILKKIKTFDPPHPRARDYKEISSMSRCSTHDSVLKFNPKIENS